MLKTLYHESNFDWKWSFEARLYEIGKGRYVDVLVKGFLCWKDAVLERVPTVRIQ